jgi:hypothetical protein
VKEVMQQNVDQMLQTHEKLEDLETKAGACAYSHRRTRHARAYERARAKLLRTSDGSRRAHCRRQHRLVPRPVPFVAPPTAEHVSTNGIAKG